MHISEGVLSAPVLGAGAAATAAGVGICVRRLSGEGIPRAAVLSAAFFVASLIHVPLGPSSVHLVLNGLLGVLLGWVAFPAVLLALFLQAILFQFGGLTTLGVNTFNMAMPGVICFYLFGPLLRRGGPLVPIGGFLTGSVSILLSGVLVALDLALTGEGLINAAKLILVAHLPVMAIEGIITAFILSFLRRVKPEMLEVAR